MEKGLKALEEEITSKTVVDDVFREVLNPLEEMTSQVESTWGLAKTLYLGNSSRMPTKSYLTIHDRMLRVRSAKFNSLPIYYALKQAQNASKQEFDEQQKRLINKYLLEGRLNGIEVEGPKKAQLNECLIKLNKNRKEFHERVQITRRAFQENCNDPQIVKELPVSLLRAISVDPKAPPKKGPWKLSLQPHVVQEFLEYCPDHNLRWNIWQADVRKCSKNVDKQYDNSVAIEEIRYNRREKAMHLGYENYMALSMETKMAGSVDKVSDMLARLQENARPAQENEIASLQSYAENVGYHRPLEIQDVSYYRRRQLMDIHNFDEDVIREYFPLNKVFNNLLHFANDLFGIKIVERSSPNRWHEDVKFYDVFDSGENAGAEPLGGFYVDLYARQDEKPVVDISQGGGWVVNIRSRSELTDTRPLSAIIFNFMHSPEKSVLLSVNEVHQLFQKFGMAIQQILTKSRYSELSGSSNIEWDAVDTVGKVLSNLLYNDKVLKTITAHYSNDDPLPEKYVTAFLQNRKQLAGFNLSRQLYHSDLDVQLHMKKDFWWDLVKELYPKYHVFELDKKDSHVCSFTPIFSGEWGGAYFSNVWSDVLAADVYSAFYEASKSQNNSDFLEVGRRFRDTFLTYGGTLSTNEVFRRFRGRDPSHKALLKSLGLSKTEMKK